MLKTLDRYILGKFLRTFLFTVLIFSLIAMVIDFSEKVEDFLKSEITTREVLLEYYPTFVMFVASLLWPLFTLIAVIFFTSRMATNSEIISIFNAGVSYRRFLRPYFIGAFLIAFINLVGNHFFIPMGNKTMLNVLYTHIDHDKDKGKTQNVHMFVAPDTKIYVEFYRKRDSTARTFRIEHFERNRLESTLKAVSARWDGATGKWRLEDYEIRSFDGIEEGLIVGRGKSLDTLLNFTPEDFVDYQEQQTMMTTPELKAYIAKQQQRGAGNTKRYIVELYRRTADAFTVFILTVLGVSIASRKVRGGIGLHLAIGILLGAVFIFFARFSIVFATGNVMPPLLGMWMPNIVFGSIALVMILRAQK